jgi:hypothetical protein
MIIKYCNTCVFHEIKIEEAEQMSYCSKENCFSPYSKCLSKHALKAFLEKESNRESKSPVSP